MIHRHRPPDALELYRHEGATGQPSSTGWTRPEKMHRSLGSGLAQQIVKHVDYDTEHGFDLACKVTSLGISPVVRAQGYSQMPGRMLPDNSQQLTVFCKHSLGHQLWRGCCMEGALRLEDESVVAG
jgi:hypothetical protein